MDLQTENRLAQLLLEEARRLRLEADKEGALAYLRKQNVRTRPNSRFLAATVLGVQQANRAAEVNEMWRTREEEKEQAMARQHCNEKRKFSSMKEGSYCSASTAECSRNSRHDPNYSPGAEDKVIEDFLHSRVKRGRGGVGARMDEPGPFLPHPPEGDRWDPDSELREKEEWERRVFGPEKPSFLKSQTLDAPPTSLPSSSPEESPSTSKKHHHKKRSKEKKKCSKRREQESRSKHHRRHRHHHKCRRRESDS